MAKAKALVEALEKSLDFERKGSEFYLKLGIDTKQALAKNLFYNLAKQEIDHIVRIEEIFDAVGRNAPLPTRSARKMEDIEDQMKRTFDKLSESIRTRKLDNIEAYRLAIEMEEEGYRIYKGFSESATDKGERQFFLALLEEERAHREALDNVYYFLTQSKDWFSVEESKVWNWMSI